MTHIASECLWPQSLRTEDVSFSVIASALMQVPRVVLGLCILIPSMGLMAHLGFWMSAQMNSLSRARIQADEDAIPTMGGSMATFFWLTLERPGLEIKATTRRWRELSACYVAVMSRMSVSWWYAMSTLLVKGAGKVSRCAATAAIF
jgi:hypothetical protein